MTLRQAKAADAAAARPVAAPELAISWANGRWRAHGAGIEVEHEHLTDLDDLVAERLAGTGARRAAMRLDFASFPEWMRQHQSHYFNYVLTLAAARVRSED